MATLSPVWGPRNLFHMVWWFLHLLWSHAAARRSAPPAPARVSDESLRDCLRTTVVTGASSGLGYAIALEVLRAQASVRGALRHKLTQTGSAERF